MTGPPAAMDGNDACGGDLNIVPRVVKRTSSLGRVVLHGATCSTGRAKFGRSTIVGGAMLRTTYAAHLPMGATTAAVEPASTVEPTSDMVEPAVSENVVADATVATPEAVVTGTPAEMAPELAPDPDAATVAAVTEPRARVSFSEPAAEHCHGVDDRTAIWQESGASGACVRSGGSNGDAWTRKDVEYPALHAMISQLQAQNRIMETKYEKVARNYEILRDERGRELENNGQQEQALAQERERCKQALEKAEILEAEVHEVRANLAECQEALAKESKLRAAEVKTSAALQSQVDSMRGIIQSVDVTLEAVTRPDGTVDPTRLVLELARMALPHIDEFGDPHAAVAKLEAAVKETAQPPSSSQSTAAACQPGPPDSPPCAAVAPQSRDRGPQGPTTPQNVGRRTTAAQSRNSSPGMVSRSVLLESSLPASPEQRRRQVGSSATILLPSGWPPTPVPSKPFAFTFPPSSGESAALPRRRPASVERHLPTLAAVRQPCIDPEPARRSLSPTLEWYCPRQLSPPHVVPMRSEQGARSSSPCPVGRPASPLPGSPVAMAGGVPGMPFNVVPWTSPQSGSKFAYALPEMGGVVASWHPAPSAGLGAPFQQPQAHYSCLPPRSQDGPYLAASRGVMRELAPLGVA
mmetsp:Transcript_87676/g.246303  ORF Transcript_87676/g.246303 Transcript_87676/m.246303 type:complete len:638 (+) Transcript_87676:77-1990(+)